MLCLSGYRFARGFAVQLAEDLLLDGGAHAETCNLERITESCLLSVRRF